MADTNFPIMSTLRKVETQTLCGLVIGNWKWLGKWFGKFNKDVIGQNLALE